MTRAVSSLSPLRRPASQRGSYHHGDLPGTLQQAVIHITAARGVGAVTMAECAKLAGVSAAAPYRHFESLDDLIVRTAEACYAEWSERRARREAIAAEPRQALTELNADYFDFARDEPGKFVLIFDSGLLLKSEAIRRSVRDEARRFTDVIAAILDAPPAQCHATALAVTGLVLGYATMSLREFSGLSMDEAGAQSRAATNDLLLGAATRLARGRAR